ncbi:MAG TPA: oligosaccharide flippase family protein [Bacteroidales bacterium]|nr:oligosaccharide flippase family protein [Bacteroidales bacterium]
MRKTFNKFSSAILSSELLRNTSILVSGTALAQLIPILLQPILRRFFAPEIFGAYSVYASLYGIIIVISSFRYELAIILPRKDNEAAGVFFLSIILNLIFNIFIFLVIILWKTRILLFLNLSDSFTTYIYLVPLGAFLFSTYQSINYWLIRKKKFFSISLNKFIRRGFEGTAQVAFKFLKVFQGLIYGDLIGQLANVISGIYQGSKTSLSLRLFSWNKIRYVLSKYSEYPKFNLVPAFMSACSYLLPAIIINKFYSSTNTGYFDLSKQLLSIPLALIATSISNVLLQRVSEKNKLKLSIRNDLLSIFLFVGMGVIIEILIITFWAEDIFRIFFGSNWIFSGTISKILVWAFAYNFIVSSFSSIFISLRKIKLLSIWQLFYFISILTLFFFNKLSFTGFLKVYVMIEIVCCSMSALFIFYIVVNYERMVSKMIPNE